MIRLVQVFGAHSGRIREFEQARITFGRLPSNDFAFDPYADLDASGTHAEVVREGERWVLVDLHSRNGTLVRGQAIQRHPLAHGDEVEFGSGGPRVIVEFPTTGTLPAVSLETPLALPPTAQKIYGQHTLDVAVEAATQAARAERPEPTAFAVPVPVSQPTNVATTLLWVAVAVLTFLIICTCVVIAVIAAVALR